MDKKLTDSEIVKALECCPKNVKCEQCSLCGTSNCMNKLSVFALDLINRLQAENDKLKKAKYIFSTVDYCADDLDKALKENEQLKADCENYKQVAENQQKVTLDKGFEIKRLKEENERLKIISLRFLEEMRVWGNKNNIDTTNFSMIPILESEKESLVKQIKAEAYKEFAERLKELFPSDNEPYQYWEIHEGADNLLKELVGDENG